MAFWSQMATHRRSRVSFTAPPPLRLRFVCCASTDPAVRPGNGGNSVSVAPQRRARLSVVRVRELEVRAAARAASLRIAEASDQLDKLAEEVDGSEHTSPAAAAESAAVLVATLEREVRALQKLGDARIEKVTQALEALCEKARLAAVATAKHAAAEKAAVATDVIDDPTSENVAFADKTNGAVPERPVVARKIVRGVRSSVARGSEELAKAAESVRSGIGERVTSFVREDGTIDLKSLRALVGAALDSVGNVWLRLNGRTPRDGAATLSGVDEVHDFTPVLDEEEQFRLRKEISVLERELKAASKARESVLRREDQLGKLIRAKEIRSMDDSVSAVRRALAVRVLQLEMEKIFVSLADELAWSSVDLVQEQRLLIAEFGELDGRLLEMCVFVDNGEPALVGDDALGDVAADIEYLKTRLGLDAPLYTSATLDMMQVRKYASVSLKKTREGLEFYARGFRLFIGDLQYAARLFRRAVGGYTPTPREVRTLRRTGRDLVALIPFTIIMIAPITPAGHVFVFSFIQRIWPEFFPSTFSERRQELMKRYEKYASSINGDELVGLAETESARPPQRKRGVLGKILFFWRWFEPEEKSVSTKSTGETAGATDNDALNVAAESTGMSASSGVKSELENAKLKNNGKSNGVAKGSTGVVADSKGKSLGIDDVHLAD